MLLDPNLQCRRAECTVLTTGKCVLSYPSPLDCPSYQSEDDETAQVDTHSPEIESSSDEIELEIDQAYQNTNPFLKDSEQPLKEASKVSSRQFHAGLELGLSEANDVLSANHGYLVGILGSQDVGKTCLLVSLYLLATHGSLLPRFCFADSRTIKGFELRGRRLRNWPKRESTAINQRMTERTFIEDDRSPAFLHLAMQVQRNEDFSSPGRFDLLLTDLPGEWTDDLIDSSSKASRFDFLRRADTVVIVIEAPSLLSPRRRITQNRIEILLQRLRDDVKLSPLVPILLVITKTDMVDDKPVNVVENLLNKANGFGFKSQVEWVSAFSTNPERMASGTGISAIVDYCTQSFQTQLGAESDLPDFEKGDRSFSRL
jgi:GTPase SAR1 family protein